jgi:hypothetical protein
MIVGKILLVTKLKGGSGATRTCRELAVAAVADGLRVALVDLWVGHPSDWTTHAPPPPAARVSRRAVPVGKKSAIFGGQCATDWMLERHHVMTGGRHHMLTEGRYHVLTR